jgi:hypothetical protein
VNGEQALVPILGPSEARRLTDEVKRDAEALWRKLVELYEAGANTALNYPSWADYCSTEFGFGRRHSYRLLEAGRVAERVTHGTLNERQARELAPLLRDEDEDAVVEVWHELRSEYGERLTAERVRTAVEKRLAPTRPREDRKDRPRDDRCEVAKVGERDFQKAVCEALTAFGWRWTHFRPARTGTGWRTPLSGSPGYPDISAVRGERILFVELKAANGKLRDEQRSWLSALGAAGAEVHCWRPGDWPVIEGLLR